MTTPFIKSHFVLLFLFFTSIGFAQGEANIWYFGNHAGLDFNSGSPVALTNGQLVTDEGCATLSNAAGQLLFYTDGVTVYNKNHQIMVNGTGLMGDNSTTQSATIVQKPGSTTLFYIFTIDYEAQPNGFRYSIVDLTLDNGLGAVTSNKNVLIYTPTCEKISIIKHANDIDCWIVTHGFDNNTFYAHLLTSSGLSTTPVLSNAGFTPTTPAGSPFNKRASYGYMKIAPNGSKLAVVHAANAVDTGVVELYDFNNNTGIVSNPITLLTDFGEMYGVEFSPNSQVLYYSNISVGNIRQFDLTASNIPASELLFSFGPFSAGALQLGPDKKIYFAMYGKNKIGVINNPDTVGSGCNLQSDAIDLGGRVCILGLPAFNQSFFFQSEINLNNICEGENTQFSLITNQTITGAIWDFGDGSPTQNSITGNHVYAIPASYTVSVTATGPLGTRTNTRQITIYPKPVINPVVALKQCDDDLDGFSAFNLTEANSKISTNFANETFSYFKTAAEAQNNANPILNFTAYTNPIVSNDIVHVRVENANGCFRIAQLNLNVSTTQVPVNFTRSFTVCDDAISGTNTDGIAAFDFSSVDTQIRGLFPVGQQLTITYYRNVADALSEQNNITNISNYRNTGYPNSQNIYTRVDSDTNNDCLLLKSFITLNVERIPIVQPQTLVHCDDDQDGKYGFNTANLQATVLNGLTNVNVLYFDQNNNPLPSPLPNPFVTASQVVKVVVKNATATACDYATTITFKVDDLPEAFTIPTNLTTVCDDEANPSDQDGKLAFNTSSFQSLILGSQTGMIVKYYDANNNPLPSPLPNPFVTATQTLRVEVINPTNTTCTATTTIPFIINPVPNINLAGDELVCNEQTITKTIEAGITDNTPPTSYTYIWKRNGVLLPTATGYSLNVNQEGSYTVEVTNTQGCSRTRTITVRASNTATIQNVQVTELTDNNSIVVNATGQGDYVYSLDNVNYQSSNTFSPIEAGIYTVYVKDLNGCGIAQEQVSVLGIPKFFTPNGDGYNDYWNIQGATTQLNAKTEIQIFDRYGKFLKQISPTGQGWNGTFNNQPLPADDYWYTITLEKGQILKGHFALKR